jgi:hypothetical protein
VVGVLIFGRILSHVDARQSSQDERACVRAEDRRSDRKRLKSDLQCVAIETYHDLTL